MVVTSEVLIVHEFQFIETIELIVLRRKKQTQSMYSLALSSTINQYKRIYCEIIHVSK